MMRTSISIFLLCCLLAPVASAQVAPEAHEAGPKNVILFIADGTGPATFTMARDYVRYQGGDGLTIDSVLVGAIRTYATNSRVTDSAAGATAFAAGVKTYNGAIAVDTLQQPVATVLEAAQARGMATGLVATSSITHATPAAFAAHVPNRSMETEIAVQQLAHRVDVLFGGGSRFFLPSSEEGIREDGRNLLAEAETQGYTVVQNRAGFDTLTTTPALALFTPGHMAYEIDRDETDQPSLAEMTAQAIALLGDDPNGFFLMVEGSRIDHAGHANDPAAHLHDLLAFDRAIAVALDFARANGETLILSTSDHETGGLSVGRAVDGQSHYAWQPDVLERVQSSVDHMMSRLRQSDSLHTVIEEEIGIVDLTEAEWDTLSAQYEARDDALFGTFTEMISRRALLGWTTGGHTGVDVNLYAYGPGRDRFIGHHDNTAIGLLIAELMDFDLAALTDALRRDMVGSQ